MKLLTKHIIVFLSLATVVLGKAGAQVGFQIDSTTFTIGEQVTLTITGADIYPSAEQLSQDGMVAVEQWFDTLADGKAALRTRLTSFDAGEHCLRLTDHDSIIFAVADVDGVDTASLDIKDIAGIMSEPYTFWEIFRWVLAAIAALALIAGILYAANRYKHHRPLLPIPTAPPTPPHETALNDLEALRIARLWQNGHVKEYHTRLTDIIRSYIEAAWGIRSTEMTTDETLEAFGATAASNRETQGKLRDILTTADLVKFAKSEPLDHVHVRAMDDAVAFVQLTLPTPDEPQKADASKAMPENA